ncbi:MAG: hypothetical protein R2719_02960 [Micropruina sp.]
MARAEPSAVEPRWAEARVTTDVVGATAEPGGMPQVSQQPSTIAPEQPGCRHGPVGMLAGRRLRRAPSDRHGDGVAGHAADVAVAVDDGAGAARLAASSRPVPSPSQSSSAWDAGSTWRTTAIGAGRCRSSRPRRSR